MLFRTAVGNNAPEFIGNLYATNNVSQVLRYPRGCINFVQDFTCGEGTANGRVGGRGVC